MSTNAKKFILLIIKFGFIFLLAYSIYQGLFWYLWQYDKGPKAYSGAYQNALTLQYHALADDNREPEVIVFGSSYVPFGIDTDVLSEETGCESQILGVEASLGIPVLVDILKETAKPGDTIVYMLGKSNWYNEDFIVLSCAFEGDKDLLDWYWSIRPGKLDMYKKNLVWRKLYALIASRPVEAIRSSISDKIQVYSRESFDEKGNMIAIEREGTLISTEVNPSDTLTFEEMELETMDMLNEFKNWCDEQGISFVICYSPNIDGSIGATDDQLLEYHHQMMEYIDADILLTPQDYFLPVTDFYNHYAHLNSEGARKYSHVLGSALRSYMDGESATVINE